LLAAIHRAMTTFARLATMFFSLFLLPFVSADEHDDLIAALGPHDENGFHTQCGDGWGDKTSSADGIEKCRGCLGVKAVLHHDMAYADGLGATFCMVDDRPAEL